MSVKISELPILSSLADNDIVAGVDVSGNVTSKIEMATLKNYIDTNTQYTAGTNIDITNNVISAPDVYNKDEMDNQIEELQSEVDSLSMIYNAFPTESGEGESVTLDDTAEVKFKKFDLKGNTSQESTTGINLFCPDAPSKTQVGITVTNNGDGTFSINGTATANVSIPLTIASIGQPLTGEQPYTMAIDIISNGGSGGSLTTEILKNGTTQYNFYAISPAQTTGMKVQVSTPSEDATIRGIAYYVGSGGVVNNLKIRPYLVKGSYTASNVPAYEPYTGGTASPNPDYPQEVHTISGDNEINVCGKNLLNANFNANTINGVTQIGVNNVITLNGANNKAHSFDFPNTITYEPNTTYTTHVKIIGGSFTPYKQDSNWAIQLYNLNGVSNITLTSNNYNSVFQYSFNKKTTTKPRIWFGWEGTSRQGTDGVFNNLQIQIMVVKGAYSLSNYPTFEPYDGNIYDINLPVENKFDDNTTTNILITDDGTEQANNAIKTSTYIKVEPNTLYTCSSKLLPDKTSGWLKFSYYDASKNYLSYLYTDNTIRTITTPNNCGYIRIGYHTSIVNDVQFEKGSKANSYTPYGTTPIELCKIGNYQDEFRKSTGKNLLQSGYRQGNTTSTTATNRLFTTHSVYVEANKTYTISTNINVSSFYWAIRVASSDYPATADITTGDWNTTSSQTYTPTQNGYLAVIIGKRDLNANISESEIGNTYFQVEVGGNATDPEPYGKGKWYKYGAIGKVVLNGSENWGLQSINNYGIANFVYDNTGAYSSGSYVRSNYFKNQNTTIGGTTESGIFNNANSIYIRIDQTIANTVANFKTWLSTHNTIVYYVLATPTNTEITYRPLIDQLNLLEKAMSKDGQTNISQVSNDKPFILDVTAIKSLQSVLDRIELLES